MEPTTVYDIHSLFLCSAWFLSFDIVDQGTLF